MVDAEQEKPAVDREHEEPVIDAEQEEPIDTENEEPMAGDNDAKIFWEMLLILVQDLLR